MQPSSRPLTAHAIHYSGRPTDSIMPPSSCGSPSCTVRAISYLGLEVRHHGRQLLRSQLLITGGIGIQDLYTLQDLGLQAGIKHLSTQRHDDTNNNDHDRMEPMGRVAKHLSDVARVRGQGAREGQSEGRQAARVWETGEGKRGASGNKGTMEVRSGLVLQVWA